MKQLEINLSEQDLQELINNKEFNWEFDKVKVHLFKGGEE